MAYDMQSQMFGQTVCTALANSPPGMIEQGLKAYDDLYIPRPKLILGVPWYGYVYPCTVLLSDVCRIAQTPFRGVKCSDAAGREYKYRDLMAKAEKHNVEYKWSDRFQSPYFHYYEDEVWHQVWYDDVKSLRIKYALAKEHGLRGVGMWAAEDLDNSNRAQIRDFWSAIP